jgi:hypothetical protein
MHEGYEKVGDKESPKACTRLKSCASLYTCPWIPFIGRLGDFYIPRLPSNLENIPSVTMYKNVFYISWFARLISYIYRPATSSHFKPDFWSDVFDLASPWPPKLYSWKSPLIGVPELRLLQTLELRRFLVSCTSPVSNHPETNNRFANWSQFGYYFRISLEGQRNVWYSSGSLHECFLFTKQNFPSRG